MQNESNKDNSRVISFRFSEEELKLIDNMSNSLTYKNGIKFNRTMTIKWCINNLERIRNELNTYKV